MFKNILKKTINKLYLNEWYTTRQDYCSGKLDTYCKLKTHFGCEKYINEIKNSTTVGVLQGLEFLLTDLKLRPGGISSWIGQKGCVPNVLQVQLKMSSTF